MSVEKTANLVMRRAVKSAALMSLTRVKVDTVVNAINI
jgi:hypothetical protein